jgi:anti-sigma regulatory factor (Ser/Thr protein kinase)
VPVIDALRSALGEVDEYPRVDIGRVEPARLPMSVAADLAHILAELIENGLNFSPPDTSVDIEGHHTAEGYRITVVDHGIGMSDDQVATANRRLSGNESFTVAPSRYMGHYVAGHLATGLGIEVVLASTSDDPDASGTTATVDVPEDLLAHPAAEAERVPVFHSDSDAASFQPAAPPPAPAPESQTESLSSLLSVHRRLSRPDTTADPDRSPWAARQDLPSSDADDRTDV